jgi:cell wall assembly regulator SMI1
MYRIEGLISKVREQGHDVWVSGPATKSAIDALQAKIGVQLPESLVKFLLKYGAIGIYDTFLSGIIDDNPLELGGGGIFGDTHFLREDFPNIPSSFWVVEKHEAGAYCLDLNAPTKNGEYEIVNFEGMNQGQNKCVATSFENFVCEWVLEGLANEPA